MRCRTQRFQNSFYPDAVNCWNDIGPDIRKLDTLKSFKSNLTDIIKPKCKSVFKIHSSHLKYLYQLRVGLSPLKSHKFKHKFEDTPSSTCLCSTGAETTDHFLLFCPIFNAHREKLMDTVNPIVSRLNPNLLHFNKILLYGSESLNQAENKAILEATLSFITNTGRFSP